MGSSSSRLGFVFVGRASGCIQSPREANIHLHPTGTHQSSRHPVADTVCYNGVNCAHHLPGCISAPRVQAEKGERHSATHPLQNCTWEGTGYAANTLAKEQRPEIGSCCPLSCEPMTSAMLCIITVAATSGFNLSA